MKGQPMEIDVITRTLAAVKSWIDLNKKNAPDCSIQCRVPGTSKILYA